MNNNNNLEDFFSLHESVIPISIILNNLHVEDIMILASCSKRLFSLLKKLFHDESFKSFTKENFENEGPIIDCSTENTHYGCDNEFDRKTKKIIEKELKKIRQISKTVKFSYKLKREGCNQYVYTNDNGDKFRCLIFEDEFWYNEHDSPYDDVLEYQKNNKIIMQIGTISSHPFLKLILLPNLIRNSQITSYDWCQSDGSSSYNPKIPANLPYYEADFRYLDPRYNDNSDDSCS